MGNPKRDPTNYEQKEESRTNSLQTQNYKPKTTAIQNYNHQRQHQNRTLITNNITKPKQNINESNIDIDESDFDNDNESDSDNDKNTIINIKSWTASCKNYPNNLQATPMNSSVFYVTAFARSQVKHMKPLCKKKKPPQFTLLKSRASPPDSTLINDYVKFQNLAFEHALNTPWCIPT